MFFELEYNAGGASTLDIRFPIIKRGVVDFAVSADWTPATGDVKVSKDGANFADAANLPSLLGGTGAATWKLSLSAAELQCKELWIQIVDSATKAIEDQALCVRTYGHPSAFYIVNKSKPRGLVSGVCTTGGSATSIATSSLVPAVTVADQLKGRIVIFDDNTTTAALRGQATDITANTSGGVLTVTALTTAPASGDVFFVY